MPVTTNSLFTGVTETTSGGLSSQWTDLANVLAEAGEASSFYANAVPTYYIVVDTPDFSAVIPPDSIVTNVEITISADRTGNPAISDVFLENASIAGGLVKAVPGDEINITPTVYTVSGDLAFWGITNQDALDFSNGIGTMVFRSGAPVGGTSYNVRVQWVKCQITYTSNLVPLPTLF